MRGVPDREAAPAKINLSLRVTGRRQDGYHLLDSTVAFASVGDTVAAAPAGHLALTVDGPFRDDLLGVGATVPDDNLVLRAARLLAAACGRIPHADLRLDKALPVASGMGGGSADAAATLRLLSRFWEVPSGIDTGAIAERLGADVPVCLAGRTARMTGIGERVEALGDRLSGYGIVLVNPGVAVATPDVFRARNGPFSTPADDPLDPLDWRNDLLVAAVSLCPPIGDVLAALSAFDTVASGLSGSGATCWALFRDAAAAEDAKDRLRISPAGWWIAAGHLL